MDQKTLARLKEKVKQLPMTPGIYMMRDKAGKIIYVGKAKLLKNRVSQYFNGIDRHTPKVYRMVQNVDDFDVIITDSELEALVLECSQIKHYMPKYNILLKDDKNYPYIKLDVDSPYPRLSMTRRRLDDRARYFGPYSGSVGEIIRTINRMFKLPTCHKSFPRDFDRERPCLNYSIKNCMGVCTGKISEQEYREAIDQAVEILEGRYERVAEELTQKMTEAAEALSFEKAALYRDRLTAIRKLADHQKVVAAPSVNRDVIGFYKNAFQAVVEVFLIRSGKLAQEESFVFAPEDYDDEPAALGEFVKQFYEVRRDIPGEILLSGDVEDRELIEAFLTQRAGRRVRLRVPQRGELKKLTNMVCKNAQDRLARMLPREEKVKKTIAELQQKLGLPKPPVRIEAIDISNTAGSDVVGAIIVFENGEPKKSGYKKYKIKSFDGQDDYAAMREVLYRRFRRYQEGDAGFDTLPDLLLLDGGKGHVATVRPLLEEMEIPVPVFGMVKDDRHRTRGLTTDSEEITISPASPAFVLVGRIQEEVHRFVIEYHRSTRGRKMLRSGLSAVPGLGPTRVKNLLTEFKTIENIRRASIDDLCRVKGMTRRAAENIKRHYGELS
ncbi:excinuclease ABC subunit UvrC [Feifania hominis]|uniref:UvrABC system protein C n=1 Tax=Feifania hominis TaxID=2763660 RepID=A0A926DC63_9FIRM|nr:excinuclease ABC subunit UvrC [Feifania hominis]MBC8535177.1 excinuclease ABC subunit UvrC [Feifania hominis]